MKFRIDNFNENPFPVLIFHIKIISWIMMINSVDTLHTYVQWSCKYFIFPIERSLCFYWRIDLSMMIDVLLSCIEEEPSIAQQISIVYLLSMIRIPEHSMWESQLSIMENEERKEIKCSNKRRLESTRKCC